MRSFAAFHPIAQAAWFLAAVGCAMFSMNPVIAGISLAGAVLLFVCRNGGRHWRSHLWFFGMLAVMILANPLISHNGATVLVVMNGQPVTAEALLFGVISGSTILAVLYWFRTFSQVMTSDRLLYLCSVLSPKLALVLSMALRYASLFADQTKKVQRSQKAVGLYKEDNLIDSLRGSMRIFSIMLTWALEHGIVTADSMAARGYGIGRRTHYAAYRFRAADGVLLGASLLLGAVTLTASGAGALHTDFYPTLTVAAPSPLGMAGYIAFGMLVLLPTLIEVWEDLKWRSYLSNI